MGRSWELVMMTRVNRITYEEVINDKRPIQTKKVLGVEVGTGASDLMVDILLRWSELMTKSERVITKIKLAEEAAIAHKQNVIDDAAPQVSVAT